MHQDTWREGKLQAFGSIGSGYHQISGEKRKNKEIVPQKNKKISGKLNTVEEISSKG